MKKFKSTLLIVVAMLLVAVISVTATIAYLKSQTDIVENTFTVGNVKITLDEAAVNNKGQLLDKNGDVWNSEGVVDKADRVIQNIYHLVPGRTYTKDPTVHVAANSEDAYLFVKVVIADGFDALLDGKSITQQMTDNGWVALNGNAGVYYYKGGQHSETVDTDGVVVKAGKDYKVFESFKLKSEIGTEAQDDYELLTNADDPIKIQAYAIQAEGFANAAAAYAADPCNWGI
jgi:hypothetical protein